MTSRTKRSADRARFARRGLGARRGPRSHAHRCGRASRAIWEVGAKVNQVIADLPLDRQVRIDARYREMKDEIEGLREFRQVAGKALADIASALNIKRPSVPKIVK
jgi:hypothetical protein